MNRLCLGLLAALSALPACTSTFEKDWRHAATVRSSDPFAGRWEGRWISAKHPNSGGALLCLLQGPAEPGKNGPLHYQARFKAKWLTFHAEYAVPLEARRKGDTLVFSGTHQLPAVYGGEYRFEGLATPERFSSSYSSSYDHGRFEMQRPAK